MLHVEDFIEVYCLLNNKTPRGMAERDLPLVLILLMIFVIHRFLPPNLPPNDRLRRADFKHLPRACV